MRTHDWFRSHSFHYPDFGNASELGQIKRDRDLSVSLILPTRNVAETITSVLDEVNNLRHPDIGLIDQVIVVDADSTDGTAEIAHGYDAEVYSENALMPEYGPAHGKGDAMWRGLSVATGDLVAFADTDTGNFCTPARHRRASAAWWPGRTSSSSRPPTAGPTRRRRCPCPTAAAGSPS